MKPDVTIAATDAAFADWPFGRARPLVGETWSDKAAGRWRYVLAMNPDDSGPSTVEVSVARRDGCAVWDWRAGAVVDVMAASLEAHDWRLWIEAPLLDGTATFGDPALYAMAGDRRLADVAADGSATVVGAPGESLELVSWSAASGTTTTAVVIPSAGEVVVGLS